MTVQTQIQRTNDGLLLSGLPFESSEGADWELMPFDGSRWLLSGKKQQQSLGSFEGLAGVMDCEVLTASLIGLIERRFSGCLAIDTGRGVKKLFFQRGELTFASSNLIDDRLGEVIYRAGFISLEEMTNFAVQVNRATRFGRVLLNNKIMSSVGLWDALKLQVAEIVRSVFLVDRVFFQIQKSGARPPTAIVFAQGTRDLVGEASGFGSMFRHFVRKLTLNTKVELLDKDSTWVEPNEGTFEADLCGLIRAHGTLGDLKHNSKLSDINTWVALFQLVSRGVCRLENTRTDEPDIKAVEGSGVLRRRIGDYGRMLAVARQAFQEANVTLPIAELQTFVRALGMEKPIALYLTATGDLSAECAGSLFLQVAEDTERLRRVEAQLESLIQFLGQLVGDFLSSKKAKEVRQVLSKQNT